MTLISCGKLLFRQLQEGLPDEPSTGIEYSRSQRRIRILLRDLVKSGPEALRIRQVRTETRGLAAVGVDLVNHWLKVGGVAS